MKGIVFTEFLEMIEARYSPALADAIIEACPLASRGSYTAVGTYDHQEMIALVTELGRRIGMPVSAVLLEFGRHLFSRFVVLYPVFFAGVSSTFDFLMGIESYIHTEVRKLYPDAELPTFESTRPTPERMELVYRSSRPFADLAEGLMIGCASHFAERIAITRREIEGEGIRAVHFTLTKQA